MALEIERKFLVTDDSWQLTAKPPIEYRQAYLSSDPYRSIRVRTAGEKAFLTIKGRSIGAQRSEFDYPIPYADAVQMMQQLCRLEPIVKDRYTLEYRGLVWEVDQFKGSNAGLIVAEVELSRVDQPVELPEWVGTEVTEDPRYFNAALYQHPFNEWNPDEVAE